MNADPKKEFKRPAMIALLGLQALAGYAASGLVQEGDKMHSEMALRLVRVIDKDRWT